MTRSTYFCRFTKAVFIALMAFARLGETQADASVSDGVASPDIGIGGDRKDRWVLGAALRASPTYTGATGTQLGLRPVLAGRVGRWMLSTSSARALANMDLAGGISTTVVQDSGVRLSVGARSTHGRKSGDDAMLQGLPSIRSSLGLRLGVAYTPVPNWQLLGNAQQDLLRGQGLQGGLGLGWSTPIANGWVLNAGGSLGWVDGRFMRTFYGVLPEYARSDRPAWSPGGGLESRGFGVGLSHAVSPHWRLTGNMGVNTLMGAAAKSPLTQKRTTQNAQVTLAYVGW